MAARAMEPFFLDSVFNYLHPLFAFNLIYFNLISFQFSFIFHSYLFISASVYISRYLAAELILLMNKIKTTYILTALKEFFVFHHRALTNAPGEYSDQACLLFEFLRLSSIVLVDFLN